MTSREGVSTVRRFRCMRGDDGAAAVEFSFIFVFIFLPLVFGMIATGTAFSRQMNLTQAAREASRYGATYDIAASDMTAGGVPDGTLSTWLPLVDAALCQAMNNGQPCNKNQASNPLAGYDYRCVAFVTMSDSASPTVTTTKSMYRSVTQLADGSEQVGTGQDSCPGVTPAPVRNGHFVQVVASRDTNFFIFFASPKFHVDAVSSSPYEGITLP